MTPTMKMMWNVTVGCSHAWAAATGNARPPSIFRWNEARRDWPSRLTEDSVATQSRQAIRHIAVNTYFDVYPVARWRALAYLNAYSSHCILWCIPGGYMNSPCLSKHLNRSWCLEGIINWPVKSKGVKIMMSLMAKIFVWLPATRTLWNIWCIRSWPALISRPVKAQRVLNVTSLTIEIMCIMVYMATRYTYTLNTVLYNVRVVSVAVCRSTLPYQPIECRISNYSPWH